MVLQKELKMIIIYISGMILYQAASAAASPKYVKLHFFLKIFIFHKIIVAVFVYMFYC